MPMTRFSTYTFKTFLRKSLLSPGTWGILLILTAAYLAGAAAGTLSAHISVSGRTDHCRLGRRELGAELPGRRSAPDRERHCGRARSV